MWNLVYIWSKLLSSLPKRVAKNSYTTFKMIDFVNFENSWKPVAFELIEKNIFGHKTRKTLQPF